MRVPALFKSCFSCLPAPASPSSDREHSVSLGDAASEYHSAIDDGEQPNEADSACSDATSDYQSAIDDGERPDHDEITHEQHSSRDWTSLPLSTVATIAENTGHPWALRDMASTNKTWRTGLKLEVKSINVQRQRDLEKAIKAYPNAEKVEVELAVDHASESEPIHLSVLANLPKLQYLRVDSLGPPITSVELQTLKLHPQARVELEIQTAAGELTNDTLTHIVQSGHIVGLDLRACAIPDDQLALLKPLEKTLVKLSLGSSQIRGPGLKHLQEFSKLKALVLSTNHVSDNEHLAPLSNLTSLKTLQLSESLRLNHAGLNHISKLDRLESLSVGISDGLSEAELNALTALSKLRFLSIDSRNTDYDAVVRTLSKLASLEEISIGADGHHGNISAESVAQLQALQHLSSFTCRLFTFNNAALNALNNMPSLRRVCFHRDCVNEFVVDTFMYLNPRVAVDFL